MIYSQTPAWEKPNNIPRDFRQKIYLEMASIPLKPADVRVPGQVGFIQRRDSKCLTLAHESIKWAKNEAKKEIDAKEQRPKDKEQEDLVTGNGITFFTLNRDIRNIVYEYLFEGGMIDF
ncbi:MAG: hypothetical protein Q9191_006323 [Dirinaria sp. TL-2023a]